MINWQAKNKGVCTHPLVRLHAQRLGAKLTVGGNSNIDAERIGWGYKSSGLWAKNARCYRLFEDGFVRSLRPGYNGGALYSLIEDKRGIYYDGEGESDLVFGLNHHLETDSNPGWREVAEVTMRRFVEVGASKYNWFDSEYREESIEQIMPEKGILVIDQTAGDAAIRYGKGNPDVFANMLGDALDAAGDAPVYVRTHPDAYFRSRKSCFTSELLRDERIVICPATFPPKMVFPRTTEVYVFNSLLGMEALLHGCRLRVYGCPFYAGWGLTEDCHSKMPKRDKQLGLTELFHHAYQKYTFYFDPNTGKSCSLARILDHLELQKEAHSGNRGAKLIFGLFRWKSKLVSRYLNSPGSECSHSRSPCVARQWKHDNPKGKIYIWSLKGRNESIGANTIQIEDGFLRSVGLGADFHPSISLVFDSRGIYFDSTRPCDLEELLNDTEFSTSDREEARQLIDFLVKNRVTKYNLKSDTTADWGTPNDKVKILVPGQVESDASLRYGQSPFYSNLAFLEQVRRDNPSATIGYKPHPDVVKKLRPGSAIMDEMEDLCDVLIRDLDITPWLDTCQEVHTLTSQTGFEGLLRGKKVTCYGVPFYSGWGLTSDIKTCERRKRKLQLEELVAGVLIHYPVYLNPKTSEFMTALDASKFLAIDNAAEIFSRPLLFRIATAAKRLVQPLR
ncbi:MAG: hypothetical protein P1V20_32030 [Verrucomicrobiales bacterium]|nr:hypothetical protein [Verrucomicrobiales bacterium]